MFNPEIIIKMPIAKDPKFIFTSDGCGCAKGIAACAAGVEIDFSTMSADPGYNPDYNMYYGSSNAALRFTCWQKTLEPELLSILSTLENKLFLRYTGFMSFSDEEFKKEMIDVLLVGDYISVKEKEYAQV